MLIIHDNGGKKNGHLILQSPLILGAQNHKNKLWSTIKFVQDLVLYIYKGYWELPMLKIFG